jgi:hypothetical protein
LLAARDVQANRRRDERRELDTAEPARTEVLLLAIGDLDDYIRLPAIVDDAQASLVANGVAELADRGEPRLQRVVRLRIAWRAVGGQHVDSNGLLAIRALAEEQRAAERND